MGISERCKKLAPAAALWIVAGAAIFAGLGSYPLSDNNEGLYAAIAAGMLRTGHFLIPQIAGLPYIEKPPLLYWLMAGSFALFGQSAWAARLVPAAAAFATCVTLYIFIRRLGLRREANVAVIVFATCAGAIVLAHIVLFDMLLALGLMVALAGTCLWYVGRGESRGALRVAAVGLAAAILTKGLVAAALLGGTLLVVAWMEPRGSRGWLRRLAEPGAAALLLALAVPWHVAAAIEQRGFFWFYFINNQVMRFLGTRRPHDFHEGPWYFYLPLLALSSLPWLFLAPALAVKAQPADEGRRRAERFLLVAAAVPLVFFSVSRAKADYYTVVCLPPLAAWFSLRLGRLTVAGWRVLATCAAMTAGVMLGLVAWGCVAMPRLSGRGAVIVAMLRGRPGLAGAVAIGLVLAPLTASIAVRRRAYRAGLGFFGLQSVFVVFALVMLAAGAADQFSDGPIARAACDAPGRPPLLVFQTPEAVSAALFYCRSRFQVVDSHSGDLWFAEHMHYGAGRIFLDDEQAIRSVGRGRRPLLVPHRDLASFERSPLAAGAAAIVRAPTATLFALAGRPVRLLTARARPRPAPGGGRPHIR